MHINVKKTIEKTIGEINPYYDMAYRDIFALDEMSEGRIDLIGNSFRFGYAQGMKAARAEMKGVK